MKKLVLLIGIVIFFFAGAIFAAIEQYPFTAPQQQTEFAELTHELRCLVCQNQDLADSNAPLASDLRVEIYQQLLQGKSKQAVIEYMTARYGDFVLYKPPFKSTTYILWLAPFIMLLTALSVLVVVVKRRSKQESAV